jgi:hypothetical protein
LYLSLASQTWFITTGRAPALAAQQVGWHA